MKRETHIEIPMESNIGIAFDSMPSILLVDDEGAFRELCTQILSTLGYIVQQAADGAEALEKVRHNTYQIILLDVRMPGMNGLECLRQLKAAGCEASVIMVTAVGDAQTIIESMQNGASDFLTKPFRATELVTKIEAVLKKRQFDVSASSLKAQNDSTERRQGDRRKGKDRRKGRDRRRGIDRRQQITDPLVVYIRERASEINSRQDVARALNVTPEEVSARLHQVTGRFFRQFLHECRIQRAKELLENTDIAIGRIATQTGFATVQHFSRIFSNVTGTSPRKYRQQHRRK